MPELSALQVDYELRSGIFLSKHSSRALSTVRPNFCIRSSPIDKPLAKADRATIRGSCGSMTGVFSIGGETCLVRLRLALPLFLRSCSPFQSAPGRYRTRQPSQR